MYKLSQDQLSMVKMAAFVDELVKIAVANDTPEVLAGVYDALTGDHLLLLKQAGLLDRIRAGAGTVASKAKDVVQRVGEGGVARRMAAAGHEHDVMKNMLAPSTMRSSPIGPTTHRGSGLPKPFAVSEEGAPLAMLPKMKDKIVRDAPKVSYNPAAVQRGLVEQDLARSHAGIMASAPSAVPAGQVRYNPLDVSRARAMSAGPAAAPAAAAAAAPAAKPGLMDRLRAAIPSGGGMQPAFAT